MSGDFADIYMTNGEKETSVLLKFRSKACISPTPGICSLQGRRTALPIDVVL